MPLLPTPSYRAPRWLFNGHLQTIVPALTRRVPLRYRRERIATSDGDFLLLDWAHAAGAAQKASDRLMIFSHGLEGDSQRHYATGMARIFTAAGYDALAWNCRSCGGELNAATCLYHQGATDDLAAVVDHAIGLGYAQIALVGISMGGNLTLKYLGERGQAAPPQVFAGVGYNTPVDLAGAEAALAAPQNRIYMRRFLGKLRRKLAAKARQHPGLLSLEGYGAIRRFADFDERYTAPLHGFGSAAEYYAAASSGAYLAHLARPTLLVQAQNDPFLSPSCYPIALAEAHPHLYLEIPRHGGHVGFQLAGRRETYAELRALAFVEAVRAGQPG